MSFQSAEALLKVYDASRLHEQVTLPRVCPLWPSEFMRCVMERVGNELRVGRSVVAIVQITAMRRTSRAQASSASSTRRCARTRSGVAANSSLPHPDYSFLRLILAQLGDAKY